MYVVGVRRFVRILEIQLKWYGVAYEFRRLPSRLCRTARLKWSSLGRK
jgi:putative transposase